MTVEIAMKSIEITNYESSYFLNEIFFFPYSNQKFQEILQVLNFVLFTFYDRNSCPSTWSYLKAKSSARFGSTYTKAKSG